MITIQETLVVDAEGHAVITLPPSVKPGTYRAVLHIENAEVPAPMDHSGLIGMWRGKIGFQPGWDESVAPPPNLPPPKAGCLKAFWMAPDFDAPLEDFREYLQ